ncbi:MAG: 4-hydroxy-tetrahydrodipicolinate synthase [archaeon]
MRLRGTYTALITPFAGEEVDYEGFRVNIRHQIKEGVDGILPLGTTGETPTLTEAEQERLITIAVEEASDDIEVLVGVGSNSTAHTVENARRAQRLGANMVLVVTPYYNKPTPEGIYQHFKAVHDAISIPIVVYNIQSRTGKNIETPLLARLAQLPRIIGVKEASGNVDQMGDVIDTIKGADPTFSVMSGDDGLTWPLLALGGDGVISVVSNLVPGKVSEMVTAGLAGQMEEARRMHYALLPLFKVAFIETNPIPIKAAMGMCGMAAGGYRLPLVPMQPENATKLKAVLEQMQILPLKVTR